MSLRSSLYKSARFLGDIEAVKKGGVVGGAKRVARKKVYAKTNGKLTKILRKGGLF